MTRRKTLQMLPFYFLILLVLVFILFPFVWSVITSLKPTNEIMYSSKFHILPYHATLVHYAELLSESAFLKGMLNSSIVAISTSIITLVVSMMAAYACSRFNFKGRQHVMMSFLLTQMFPPVLLLVPLFTIMKGIGILNTYFALILAYCTFSIPFSIWLLTGYLNGIPQDMEEAASVDGCNRFTAFMKIIFPMAIPGTIAALIYIFIYAWNEFIFATMFTGPATRTISVTLYSFIGEHVIDWGLLTAGGIITSLPIIILFMFIQKNLISGLTAGAVKG
jgi:multiple sugar transport system permease protein